MQLDQEIYGVKLSTQFTLFGNGNFCQNYVSVHVLFLNACEIISFCTSLSPSTRCTGFSLKIDFLSPLLRQNIQWLRAKKIRYVTSIPDLSRRTHPNKEVSKNILCSYWPSTKSDIHARVETRPLLHHTSAHVQHKHPLCNLPGPFGNNSFENTASRRRSNRVQAHDCRRHLNLGI